MTSASLAGPDPTDAEIVSIIARTRAELPDLSWHGFIVPPRKGQSVEDRDNQHAAARARMTDAACVDEFKVAWRFLTAGGGPFLTAKIKRTSGTSYAWKHCAELWVADNQPRWPTTIYVSNGIFIVAALAAGCRIERIAPTELNAWLNLSGSMAYSAGKNGGRQWRDRQRGRRGAAATG